MVLITASFNLEWPQAVTDLFAVAGPVGSAGEQVISIDCLINVDDGSIVKDFTSNDAPPEEFRIFYQKVLIMGMIPIFVGITSVTFWSIWLKRKKQYNLLQSRFIATSIILAFLIHPTIT